MDAKPLGKQIKKCRQQRGFSRDQLAGMVGLSPATVRQYECGYKAPRLETLIRIANALDVGMDELLLGHLNVTRKIVLEGVAQKLETLQPEQIQLAKALLKTVSEHYGGKRRREVG